MHEYKKLYTLLQLISTLSKSEGLEVSRLAKRYDATERTIYRYLDLLKACGFQVEKDKHHCYWIPDADEIFRQEGITFCLEEAAIIKDAVMAVSGNHPLRNNILSKLFAHSELDATAEIIYNKLIGQNLARLTQAIKEKRQAMLKNYHSLNSDTITDRHVEPVGFVSNMQYVMAYEPESDRHLQFKPERAAHVEVLSKGQQYAQNHENQHPDAFGMNGTPVTTACLQLSDRGAHLLREGFPLAADGIEATDSQVPCRWTGTVKGFEGVGRFVMGLPGEVAIEAPQELKAYVEGRIRMAGNLDRANNKKVFH